MNDISLFQDLQLRKYLLDLRIQIKRVTMAVSNVLNIWKKECIHQKQKEKFLKDFQPHLLMENLGGKNEQLIYH
jgi:hypothetical protein